MSLGKKFPLPRTIFLLVRDSESADLQKALVWAELARQNGEAQASVLATMSGKVLRPDQLQDASQLASTCFRSGYRECPE